MPGALAMRTALRRRSRPEVVDSWPRAAFICNGRAVRRPLEAVLGVRLLALPSSGLAPMAGYKWWRRGARGRPGRQADYWLAVFLPTAPCGLVSPACCCTPLREIEYEEGGREGTRDRRASADGPLRIGLHARLGLPVGGGHDELPIRQQARQRLGGKDFFQRGGLVQLASDAASGAHSHPAPLPHSTVLGAGAMAPCGCLRRGGEEQGGGKAQTTGRPNPNSPNSLYLSLLSRVSPRQRLDPDGGERGGGVRKRAKRAWLGHKADVGYAVALRRRRRPRPRQRADAKGRVGCEVARPVARAGAADGAVLVGELAGVLAGVLVGLLLGLLLGVLLGVGLEMVRLTCLGTAR